MTTWNFGIIGAGVIADFHAKAIQHISNTRLIGICSRTLDKAQKLAEKYNCKAFDGYEKLLQTSEINIVIIATPSGFHMEPAVAAAKHGKHVLCEKPLEITLERIDTMIRAHKKSGTYLGGIFNYRFSPGVELLKKAIDEKRFGTITCASVYVPWWRSDEYYHNSWHGTWKLDGGGALMNQSIHMIDLLQYLMGPVKHIKSLAATLGHRIEAEDTSVSAIQFENNALGIIYGTTASWPGQYRRLEIMGTKGTVIQVENSFIVWKFAEERLEDAEILSRFGEIEGGGGVSDPAAIPFINHQHNIEAFISAVENHNRFEIDGYEARKAVEIVLKIYESSGIENKKSGTK